MVFTDSILRYGETSNSFNIWAYEEKGLFVKIVFKVVAATASCRRAPCRWHYLATLSIGISPLCMQVLGQMTGKIRRLVSGTCMPQGLDKSNTAIRFVLEFPS